MPPWFKLHHELRTDKKLRMMADELGIEPALVRGLWLDQDWHLKIDDGLPLTDELIADELGAGRDICLAFMVAARKYKLVAENGTSAYIRSGHARNVAPSDSTEAVRERVRRHRGRQKDASADDVTPVTSYSNETEKKRREKRRGVQGSYPQHPQAAVDNCPMCKRRHHDMPLTPDENGVAHCSVCGYVERGRK